MLRCWAAGASVRAVRRSENPGVPVDGQNLPRLVEIGLTALPKSGGAMAPLAAPPAPTGLSGASAWWAGKTAPTPARGRTTSARTSQSYGSRSTAVNAVSQKATKRNRTGALARFQNSETAHPKVPKVGCSSFS